MLTFGWVPTVANYSGTATPVVRTAKFGDGYEQRAADGLNNVSSAFSVQFNGSEDKIRAIQAFLRAAGGADSFWWSPPLWDKPGAFYSPSWTEPTKDGNVYTMSAQFQQTFNVEE